MTDNVSKIKERLNVVDVVSGYLKVQKAGANFKASCPFHNEKTPSFFISPERQMWKCFGCGAGGDIFTFVKQMEGIEFPEALRILAIRAGIELEEFDSAIKDSKDRLYQICEVSARFFEKQLNHSSTGQRAVEYLKSRGLQEATMVKFRLGFAPDTWNALSGYLRNSGFTEKEIVDAGVVIKRQGTSLRPELRPRGDNGQGIYDRFRSRIMFPISDVNGRVVGFTGRIFSAEGRPASGGEDAMQAKYINTPQTLIYDKSRILYGLNHSRIDIRKADKCLLVEGNMDAIMSYQASITNVVASSGTALTPMHLVILKRFTNNLNFCFDTDSAGAMATKRGIGMALGQDFNVKVVSIDDEGCKDPADYIQKYGNNSSTSLDTTRDKSLGASWVEVVERAKPVIEFYFDKAKENYDPESAESKKNIILAVAPFIKRLSSRVERSHWVNQLAYLLRAKEDAIEADIMSASDNLDTYALVQIAPDRSVLKPSIAIKIEAPDILNEALLSLVVRNPALFKQEIAILDRNFLNPMASQVLDELVKEDLEQFNFGSFTKKFDSDRILDLEFVYLRSQALWEGFGDEELKAEFSVIFNKLKQKTIHLHLADLGYEMRAAEATGDKTKIGELAAAFNKLTQELAEIHNFQISKS